MVKKLFFATALLLLLFLSGCIDQKDSEEKRMLCLQLSSQAFAAVPECATQQSCFDSVNSSFFGFDETVLSYPERQQLLDYKNKIALSWFYYNGALKNAKKIHDICYESAVFEGLQQQVNELNFNLSNAFGSVDAANKSAFGLMLLQQSELMRQEVSLIKEEAVFDDLTLLSGNLNALQEKQQSTDQRLFVGKYFSLISEFGALSNQYGLGPVVLNETNAIDLLGPNSTLITRAFIGNSFFLPLIAPAVSGTIDSFIASFRLSGSVSALQKFPAFEFSVLFGKFAGTQGSLTSEFAKMQSAIAQHRLELHKTNLELEQKISLLFASSREKISEIDSESVSGFDQNLLAELYFLLGQNDTAISSQRFSLSQISSLKNDAGQKLSAIEKDFSEMQKKDFLGELTLGKKASGLKLTLASLEELNENIDFLGEEAVTSLETLCSKRLSKIEKEISAAEFPPNPPKQLFDLEAKAEYYIGRFGDEKETGKRLLYCRMAVESADSFRQADENFEEYSVNLAARARDCLVFLQKLFKTESPELSDFLPVYRQLSVLQENNAGIDDIANACFSLKENIASSFSNNKSVINSQENFSRAKALVMELAALKQHYPEQLSGISVSSLLAKLERLQIFFDSESKLYLDVALPTLDEIEKNSSSLLQEAIEETQSALADYFRKFAGIREVSGSQLKIVLENPLGFAFDYPIGFRMPFDYKGAVLAAASENVSSARADSNSIFIDLKSVPPGATFLELYSGISSAAEQERLQSFLKEKDLLQKLLAEKEKELFILQDFNLSEKASALSLEIAGARLSLADAVLLADGNDFEAAEKKLDVAIKGLQKDGESINGLLVEERDLLFRLPLLSEGTNESDENLSLLRGEIYSLDSLFLKAVSSNDSNSALFLLGQMKSKALDFNSAANSDVSKAVLEAKQKADSFRALLSKNGISAKLSLLSSLFRSASDNELEAANYALPFSRTYPEKTMLKLSEYDSARLQKKLSEFDSLLEKKDYLPAFEAIQSFAQELDSGLEGLETIDESVSKALMQIEEEAIISVSAAKGFASKSGDAALEKEAALAEKELEKKNFLKAIVIAKTMQSVSALPETTGLAGFSIPAIPLALIPLAGVIAVALFARRYKEKGREQKIRLQKLFRNR